MMSGRIQQLKTGKKPQIVKCIFFTEALLFFILLSACSVNRNKTLSELDRDSIDFGVVITTESAYHSKILWFDSELEAAQEQELSYAALGSPFYVPVEDHGELFLIPQGLGNQKDTKKVIGVNKGSLEITEYPFQHIALNHMAAADDRVYAINTLNGVSCLEAWDKKNQSSKTVELPGVHFYCIFAGNHKLFAFDMQENPVDPNKYISTMHVYTSELNLLKEEDISEYGMLSGIGIADSEYLFVTVNVDEEYAPIGKILKIHQDNFTIEEISTSKDSPHAIYQYQQDLIVTHYDPVVDQGTQVSIIEPNGRETFKDLKVTLTNTAIVENSFIVANQAGIYQFQLPSFELLNSYPLNVADGYYVSAVLAVD